MSFPPLQRLEWIFWVALVYLLAYALVVVINWFLDLGHSYLVQREIDQELDDLTHADPPQHDFLNGMYTAPRNPAVSLSALVEHDVRQKKHLHLVGDVGQPSPTFLFHHRNRKSIH